MDSDLSLYWKSFIDKVEKRSFINSTRVKDDKYEGKPVTFFSGAKSNSIQVIERQYSISLPDTYKSFMEISNGMKLFDDFRLLPIEQVTLLKDMDEVISDIIDLWSTGDITDEDWNDQNYTPDEYHTFYNRKGTQVDANGYPKHRLPKEQPVKLQYLDSLIVIGIGGESYSLCLNPNIKTKGNEFEVWYIGSKEDTFRPRFLNFQEAVTYFFTEHSNWIAAPPSIGLVD
ncbi:SMI1/KNR4 family protein [Candidatus Albibeggiatoa sp. nov. NOAA]|uniref:SMI1/KNR4 family protein n=1 Tax=Candidatus Albibeggiatoa sp. nov. NOAA TaxID=3162724 RepID=UPI003302E782|nr:SMI1/KNR4 family protein [Thiotrichaceae bacterium]